jgi:hypothetical protein
MHITICLACLLSSASLLVALPQEITLNESVQFSIVINGKAAGSLTAPKGAKVTVLPNDSNNLRLRYQNSEAIVPTSKTNYRELVVQEEISARARAAEDQEQTKKNAAEKQLLSEKVNAGQLSLAFYSNQKSEERKTSNLSYIDRYTSAFPKLKSLTPKEAIPEVGILKDILMPRFQTIYFNGEKDFKFSDKEMDNIRLFVRLGGRIIAEDNSSKNGEFSTAFLREMKRAVPDIDKYFAPYTPSNTAGQKSPSNKSSESIDLEMQIDDFLKAHSTSATKFQALFIDGKPLVILIQNNY